MAWKIDRQMVLFTAVQISLRKKRAAIVLPLSLQKVRNFGIVVYGLEGWEEGREGGRQATRAEHEGIWARRRRRNERGEEAIEARRRI